jgi:colanic acid/amylovoran biosynthesis glycosyltransferase
MTTNKTLFLITPNPPLEPGEEFLRSEFPILAEAFDEIIVIHHNDNYDKKYRNVEALVHFPYLPSKKDKLNSLRRMFEWAFWSELYDMIFLYKLAPTPRRISSILGGIEVGRKFARYIASSEAIKKGNKIYVYSYWCNYIAVGLAFLKRLNPSCICITRAHGYDVYFERNELNYLPLRRLIFKNLDRIYFISRMGLNYAANKTKRYRSMRTSYLGSAPIPQNPKNRDSVCHIISCSNIIRLKRLDLIIDALAIVSTATKIKWTHFGDGPLAKTIQEYAQQKLSGKQNIQYEFKGYVVNKDLTEIYDNNSIDLFINVSESEGLPFSIIEAFSAGIPAVATDVGGTSEIVESNSNGMLLNPKPTAEEIKASIQYFAELDSKAKEAYSINAYQKWSDFFQANKNFREFVADFL